MSELTDYKTQLEINKQLLKKQQNQIKEKIDDGWLNQLDDFLKSNNNDYYNKTVYELSKQQNELKNASYDIEQPKKKFNLWTWLKKHI